MMYEEFNRIAGQVSDLAMYQRKIEAGNGGDKIKAMRLEDCKQFHQGKEVD